jgi:hypothetical protein
MTAYASYGPSAYKGTPWTYSYSNFASFYDNFTVEVTRPYQLDSQKAFAPANPQWSVSDFEPIEGLAKAKADLTLLFLSFTGEYLDQVDDPWFSAHNRTRYEDEPPLLETRFKRDSAISTLGCTEQHQFCASNVTCTELLGFDQVQNNDSFNNAMTPHQSASFDRILRAVQASSIAHIIQYLISTTEPLLASNATYSGTSGATVSLWLPESQWTTELHFWHSIAMAQLQRTLADWATGQIALEPQYLVPPSEEQDIWFCKNFMVPSSVYSSFSVLAIILIVSFGTLLIVVSLTMQKLAGLICKCLKKTAPSDSWDQDDMLVTKTRTDRSSWRPLPSPPLSSPPLPPPKDPTTCSTAQPRQSGRSVELRAIPNKSNERRISSQVLPAEDLAFSFMNAEMASSDPSHQTRRSKPPPRTPGASFTTVSLHSLESHTPLDMTDSGMGSSKRSKQHPSPGPPPPPGQYQMDREDTTLL